MGGEHHLQVMGANNVKLSKEDEEAYKQLTFFTEKEVGLCYRRFSKLLPPALLEEVDNINDPRCRVDIKKLLELPELKVNPFNVQLCRVFSGGRESLLFEEFLDMMSVLKGGRQERPGGDGPQRQWLHQSGR